ncbi:MAG TPA: outer membrane beta-barrel protein, partial [Rhizomicrobium sp.]|nr:outer membrane beta-barrel protein [Rhizomicrobium sp.]
MAFWKGATIFWKSAGMVAGFVMLSADLASAQAIGVLDRERPAYDAKGIPLGGFRLFPRLNFDTAYDDNVFRLPAAQSDWYFRETPTLRLQSQWGQHFLEVYGGADNYNYSRFSSLDLTDWNIGAAGRYDIMRGVSVAGSNTYGEY